MGCGDSKMGNDVAKMAGLGPPTNKTGSAPCGRRSRASKTGVLSLTEHKLEVVPKIVCEQPRSASRLRTLDLSRNKLYKLPEQGLSEVNNLQPLAKPIDAPPGT